MFQPGEVVCDVMAGIGPFAVPAGKKGVFVWANDKNPESFRCLEAAIKKNKVSQFVRPFCADGRAFIHQAADAVLAASRSGEHAVVTYKANKDKTKQPPKETRIPIPPTISHFVMNLPASAIEFLGSYRGVYAGHEALFSPPDDSKDGREGEGRGGGEAKAKLPLVHVHCFSLKADDETPLNDICERITRALGFPVRPGDDIDAAEGVVKVHNVRAVAPAKTMYCASFRLPREVAFAPRG